MAKFSVRVELRNSKDADYEELHKNMEMSGFSRTVKMTESGVTKYLPSAEYTYVSATKDQKQVAELAESIAKKIKPNPQVMVTKSAGRYYIGLDKA